MTKNLLLLTLLTLIGQAGLPLPDHVLYGTIAIEGRAMTQANTDVIIEARRAPHGPVIASYRLGDTRRLGAFYYELRLELEVPPVESSRAFRLGDRVSLTVRTAAGVAFEATHVLTDAGTAQRLDFGPPLDTDGNGAPEGWELTALGVSGGNLQLDTDGDGARDGDEYAAGTKPRDAGDVFRLALLSSGEDVQVRFRALRALGVGYEGRKRYYGLEMKPDTAGARWESVENHSRILGSDQLVAFQQPAGTNGLVLFRARVWLEGP